MLANYDIIAFIGTADTAEAKSFYEGILGWKVNDIRNTIAELIERGVKFEHFPHFDQDELGIWTAPDKTMVAWFKDPAGNTLSLTQFV